MIDIDVSSRSITGNGPSLRVDHSDNIVSSYHDGDAFVALADGSVRFVDDHVNPKVFASLLSISGDKEIGKKVEQTKIAGGTGGFAFPGRWQLADLL